MMIDEEGRNCTVVADGRSDVAVPLCSERASDAHLTVLKVDIGNLDKAGEMITNEDIASDSDQVMVHLVLVGDL